MNDPTRELISMAEIACVVLDARGCHDTASDLRKARLAFEAMPPAAAWHRRPIGPEDQIFFAWRGPTLPNGQFDAAIVTVLIDGPSCQWHDDDFHDFDRTIWHDCKEKGTVWHATVQPAPPEKPEEPADTPSPEAEEGGPDAIMVTCPSCGCRVGFCPQTNSAPCVCGMMLRRPGPPEAEEEPVAEPPAFEPPEAMEVTVNYDGVCLVNGELRPINAGDVIRLTQIDQPTEEEMTEEGHHYVDVVATVRELLSSFDTLQAECDRIGKNVNAKQELQDKLISEMMRRIFRDGRQVDGMVRRFTDQLLGLQSRVKKIEHERKVQ